jgi:hypothetical protein
MNHVFKLLLALAASISSTAWAVDCVPINLSLTTQSGVDSFQADHGPCDRVGNLLVEGEDIVNLDGLSELTTVGTILRIHNNPILTSVSGLSALDSVSALSVSGNDALTNLTGLSGLDSLWGSLSLRDNAALANVDGLTSLTSVGFEVTVSNNTALTDLSGLSALTSVGGVLTLYGNDVLSSLDGLSALRSVGAEAENASDAGLQIINNHSLANLNGLSSIEFLRGELWIQDNAALSDIGGLAGLTSVDGLAIKNNAVLADLNGLNALSSAGDWMAIEGNDALININGLSGVRSVGDSPGVTIISNASLLNTNGLSALTGVEGDFQIRGNAALRNVNGLSALTSVGGDMDIRCNPRLRNRDGLSAFSSVGEKLFIEGNDALTDLDGLYSLTSLGRDLFVQSNRSLAHCEGLSRLIDQRDDAEPGPGPGLDGVPDVGGGIFIGGNFEGCNSIQEILASTSAFRINPGLNDAWYNPATAGQGFFVTVFQDIGQIFLAWFTYDTERPPEDVQAMLGDPGHRWLTAFGAYADNQASLDIEVTQGGVFDSPEPMPVQNMDGTIILEFTTCNSGTVTYDIPSIDRQGVIPIERIATDNVSLCEMIGEAPEAEKSRK